MSVLPGRGRLQRALRPLGCVAVALACGLAAGCHDNLAAATAADANTCYRLPKGSQAVKVAISADDENLETCAMHLEGYRLLHDMPAATGFYEDHFIYNTPHGITAAAAQGDIHYSVYTRAEQADLDNKLHILIARDKPDGNTTGS